MKNLRRKRKRLLFQTARFFDFFKKNTEAVTFHGNSTTLYRCGSEFFPALLQSIVNAKHSICLEFYTICDDETGNKISDALIAAAWRGVRVHILYDYIGCFDTPSSFFKKLSRSDISCCAFNPPPFSRGLSWFDKRDHRKIVIIDSQFAFTGGLNIADVYSGYGSKPAKWRDVGIKIEGPAVNELLRLFKETWEEERGKPPTFNKAPIPEIIKGNDKVMIINGGPHHKRSHIRSAFRVAIAGASESVTIANPYFIPGPRVLRSLLRAAGRGVQVRLLLPYESDVPLVRLISRSYYAQLLKSGIEIFELNGAILHAKVLLIDKSWAMVGSANMDQRSFHRNYELNVVVDSIKFGNQIEEMLNSDLLLSRRITLYDHERRGFFIRFMERILTPLSWFL